MRKLLMIIGILLILTLWAGSWARKQSTIAKSAATSQPAFGTGAETGQAVTCSKQWLRNWCTAKCDGASKCCEGLSTTGLTEETNANRIPTAPKKQLREHARYATGPVTPDRLEVTVRPNSRRLDFTLTA